MNDLAVVPLFCGALGRSCFGPNIVRMDYDFSAPELLGISGQPYRNRQHFKAADLGVVSRLEHAHDLVRGHTVSKMEMLPNLTLYSPYQQMETQG